MQKSEYDFFVYLLRDDEFLITYNVVMMKYNFVKFNIFFHRIGFDQGLFYITIIIIIHIIGIIL